MGCHAVILSDGEDTVNSSLDVAEEAKESGLLVITVGIGTAAGGPIPDVRGENGLWQDADGKHVISKLNTDSLRNFAKATGGDFFVMDSNANLTAFTQAAVRKIDTHEEAFSINKIPNDLFTPFAVAALFLLILTMLSSTEWKQAKRLVIILAIGGMTPELSASPLQENAAAYSQGMAHMQAGEAEKAKEAFSLALLDEDRELQAAALYQLGQINATQTFNELRTLYGENVSDDEGISESGGNTPGASPESLQKIVDSLKQDLQPYRDALQLQPDLTRAQKNIAGIEQLIKKLEEEIERLKQQQQQQQNQQNQDQQQNQNDQNQDSEQQQAQDKDKEQKQDSDKENQDEQQKDSDKSDEQNEQQQQQEQKSGDQDQQDQQDQQDKQDEQNDQQNQQQQDEQQQQQQSQQQQQDKQEQQDKQQQSAEAAEQKEDQPSDEEKARRHAAAVLRSHMDEEQGSPIPHADVQVRPPDKDY